MVFGLALLLAVTPLALVKPQATQNTTNVRPVRAAPKMKFRGVVIGHDADTFTIRDRTRTDYQVLLTNNTSIKTHGGFLSGGKNMQRPRFYEG